MIEENGKKKQILLVDDDEDMTMMTKIWLKKLYQVETALSGEEALDYLKSNRPDLILLDYVMPGMDGPATLEAIRNNPATAEIPVFFRTGKEEQENIETAEKLHAQGFLQKSEGKKVLLAALEDYFKA